MKLMTSTLLSALLLTTNLEAMRTFGDPVAGQPLAGHPVQQAQPGQLSPEEILTAQGLVIRDNQDSWDGEDELDNAGMLALINQKINTGVINNALLVTNINLKLNSLEADIGFFTSVLALFPNLQAIGLDKTVLAAYELPHFQNTNILQNAAMVAAKVQAVKTVLSQRNIAIY